MSKAASLLLVVDVQRGFIHKQTERVIAPINRLLAEWRQTGQPVAFSRFINPAGGLWERLRDWHGCKTEADTALHDSLEVKGDLVLEKQTYSAWGPDLEALCRKKNISKVVLCGVDTNECVLATAISIFDAGLVPVVVRDACASQGVEFHETALKLLEVLLGKEQVVSNRALSDG